YRLRRMGMPPGRGVIVTFTMHVPIMRMTIRAMVMMVVIVGLMIMVVMVIIVIMTVAIVSVMFVACVGVEQILGSARAAGPSRPMHRSQSREESPSFDPKDPQTENDDQGVAHGFDHVHSIVHGRCRRIEQRCGDAYDHHCDQRLDQRRSE